MKNKILLFTNKTSLLSFYFFLSTFISFLIIRIFEYITITVFDKKDWDLGIFWQHSVYLDFITALYMSIILFCILMLLSWIKPIKTAIIISQLFFSLIIISQTLLTGFFFSSKMLLGDEVTKFSLTELYVIITTGSNIFSIIITLIGIIFCILFSFYIKRLVNKPIPLINFLSIAVIITITLIWNNNKKHLTKVKNLEYFNNIFSFYLGNSKIPYFLTLNTTSEHNDITYTEKELSDCITNFIKRSKNHSDKAYPFLSNTTSSSTLSPYFNKKNTRPNLVFLVVEGLSSAFSGEKAYLGSHTPFIDSLAKNSLAWPNAISCAERTYGALPHILGSLPYGADHTGFINQISSSNPIYPNFSTIFNLLDQFHYNSYFQYPAWGEFDHTTPFLKQASSNIIINDISEYENYFEQNNINEKKYNWGFDDYALFNTSFNLIDYNKSPFISTYLTLGIHSPFDYEPRNGSSTVEYLESKSHLNTKIKNKEIAKTIHLTDDAIKLFFKKISKYKSFQNTIFIITGDHNIGNDVHSRSPIEFFRVPLIIYSPLLNTQKEFPSIVTHRDITPSIVRLLSENYNLNFDPQQKVSFTGVQLDTSSTFGSNVSTSLCLYHQILPQYIEGKYFITQNNLYQLTDNQMNCEIIKNDSIKNILTDRVRERKILNDYTLNNNKLIPKN